MTRCPRCKTRFVRLAPRQGVIEYLFAWLTCYPHRCQMCAHRFLAVCGRLSHVPQRNFQRVPVSVPASIRSAFFQPYFPPVPGQIVNLSIGGCRLQGAAPIPEGARLRLELDVDGRDKPVIIDEAVVCSRPGPSLGLTFTKVRRDERRRIGRLVKETLSSSRPLMRRSQPTLVRDT